MEWQDLVYGHMESGTDLEEGDFVRTYCRAPDKRSI